MPMIVTVYLRKFVVLTKIYSTICVLFNDSKNCEIYCVFYAMLLQENKCRYVV